MGRNKAPGSMAETYATSSTDVAALMAEFNEDPEAYMDKRVRLLRGDGLYEEALKRVTAEQNAELRAVGRRFLQSVLHPFARRRDDASAA